MTSWACSHTFATDNVIVVHSDCKACDQSIETSFDSLSYKAANDGDKASLIKHGRRSDQRRQVLCLTRAYKSIAPSSVRHMTTLKLMICPNRSHQEKILAAGIHSILRKQLFALISEHLLSSATSAKTDSYLLPHTKSFASGRDLICVPDASFALFVFSAAFTHTARLLVLPSAITSALWSPRASFCATLPLWTFS